MQMIINLTLPAGDGSIENVPHAFGVVPVVSIIVRLPGG